ncbi:hypothetical protein V1508DRAFT_397681 [Lipomyces doorenjongii]|uniref:uncharacterized protein n=1 Tax=Lipomyces doorenjongii TaxID=383834 RepID=UPI0034CD4230
MSEPAAAAKELECCVKELGFVGALVDNHLNWHDERFWSVFEKAQELNISIYIHPSFASDSMMDHYKGNYTVAMALSAYGWAWHTETGLHPEVIRHWAL